MDHAPDVMEPILNTRLAPYHHACPAFFQQFGANPDREWVGG
ncbi:MAG: hypothetical protein WCF90_11085 [Methanomicrobiales archaeon]